MAKSIWSIGKRSCSGDFGRKIKMSEALVASVPLYGSEIWKWFKDDRIDRVKKKWVLGLDRDTPNYIVEEESSCETLSTTALKRAFSFEEKTAKKPGEGKDRRTKEEMETEDGVYI